MNLEDRIASGAFTLIAEIGVNYYDIARQRGISPMEAAKLMCKEASEAGVHAVKFQTYKAESLERGILNEPIRAFQAIRLVWREGVSRTFRLLRLDRDRFLLDPL